MDSLDTILDSHSLHIVDEDWLLSFLLGADVSHSFLLVHLRPEDLRFH
jgi:hypothetical protein